VTISTEAEALEKIQHYFMIITTTRTKQSESIWDTWEHPLPEKKKASIKNQN
jgi:ribosomal silencing factor RsfS